MVLADAGRKGDEGYEFREVRLQLVDRKSREDS